MWPLLYGIARNLFDTLIDYLFKLVSFIDLPTYMRSIMNSDDSDANWNILFSCYRMIQVVINYNRMKNKITYPYSLEIKKNNIKNSIWLELPMKSY